MIASILLCAIPLCFFAFTMLEPGIGEDKFDPPLRKKIDKLRKNGIEQEIRVVGQCALPLNDRLCRVLAGSGINFIAVVDSVFIARGNVDHIKNLGQMPLITQLQLSVAQVFPEK